MANLSISQLETASSESTSDLFEVAIPDQSSATGYASRKMSMAQIADFIATGVQFTGLTTEAKNIIAAINEASESGSGGTTDYEDLDNKPSINSVELIGDKSLEDLGILDDIFTSTTPTLSDSKEGGLKIIEFSGKSEQDGTPTPEDPIEIESAVVDKVRCVWKNLLEITAESQTINGVTFTVNEDGTIDVTGTPTGLANLYLNVHIPLTSAFGHVVLSGLKDTTNIIWDKFALHDHNGDEIDSLITSGKNQDNEDHEFDLSQYPDLKYAMLIIKRKDNGIAVSGVVKPMIRLVSIEDATFEPYQESSIQLLSPLTLNGIGDVKDRIIRKDGQWQVERKFGTVDLGTLHWTKQLNEFYTIGVPTIYYPTTDTTITNRIICSGYMEAKRIDTYSASVVGISLSRDTYKQLCVYDPSYTVAGDFETAMDGIMLVYEKVTPTYEILPEADQIALNSLLTFDTVTYLQFESEGLDPDFEVEYGISKVGGYAIEALNNSLKPKLHAYSTQEQIVGTWIDGRPVYVKTYRIILQTSTSTADLVSEPGIVPLRHIEGYAIIEGTNNYYALPYNSVGNYARLVYNKSTEYIGFEANQTWSAGYTLCFTNTYVKDSDI